jgi:hypothetical protein
LKTLFERYGKTQQIRSNEASLRRKRRSIMCTTTPSSSLVDMGLAIKNAVEDEPTEEK